MSFLETKNFGTVTYEEASVIEFPAGLPGFENRRRFLALSFERSHPLVFLQSLEDPSLCFITLPVLAVDRNYNLQVSPEDLAFVGLPTDRQPRIGSGVLCLTILSLQESGPTANLLAPIVVNLANLRAVQAIAPESSYSHQHPLIAAETTICS